MDNLPNKSKLLSILFWNARSINKRKHELETLLKNIDVFLCVESWLQDSDDRKDHIYASGFVQYKHNRKNHRGGGILIMVRKTIAFDEISIISPHKSVELCGIQLTNANPTLNIVVCYRVPGFTLLQSIWDSIVQSLDNTQAGILVGDFNSHNIICNCTHSDTNGKHLAKSINENDLFLHNHDSITRTDPYYKTNSNIDLLFST